MDNNRVFAMANFSTCNPEPDPGNFTFGFARGGEAEIKFFGNMILNMQVFAFTLELSGCTPQNNWRTDPSYINNTLLVKFTNRLASETTVGLPSEIINTPSPQ